LLARGRHTSAAALPVISAHNAMCEVDGLAESCGASMESAARASLNNFRAQNALRGRKSKRALAKFLQNWSLERRRLVATSGCFLLGDLSATHVSRSTHAHDFRKQIYRNNARNHLADLSVLATYGLFALATMQ
jgi:hypothetical protein